MQAAGFSLILQEEIGIILSISQKNRSLPMTCSRHCSNRACGCNAGFCNLGENLRLYFSSAAWGQQGWGQDLQLFTYQAPAGVIRCFFLSNSEFLCQEVTRNFTWARTVGQAGVPSININCGAPASCLSPSSVHPDLQLYLSLTETTDHKVRVARSRWRQ